MTGKPPDQSFDLLWASYRSGQISEMQLTDHLSGNDLLAAWWAGQEASQRQLDSAASREANPSTFEMRKEMTMSRKRFEYKKMTAAEFRSDLKSIGMSIKAFARITGSVADRAQKWLHGEEDIPTWVPIMTAIMRNVPGAIPEARQEAAERIIRDLSHPELGEFPYLDKEGPDDDTD